MSPTSDDRYLSSLQSDLVQLYRVLRDTCLTRGILIKITQGFRTEAEQQALWDQGRTRPGLVVTQARSAKDSPHGYGAAFDIVIFDGSKPSWEEPKMTPRYNQVGAIGEALGLEWGGRFPKADKPHFQLARWKDRFKR